MPPSQSSSLTPNHGVRECAFCGNTSAPNLRGVYCDDCRVHHQVCTSCEQTYGTPE